MRPGFTVVLNGPSSSGKSSIAAALQQLWDGPLQVSGIDTFLACQSPSFFGDGTASAEGFEWLALPGKQPEVRIRVGRLGEAVLHAAHAYWRACAQGGVDQVIDDVWLSQAAADGVSSALGDLPTAWIGVRCPLDVLVAREQQRGDRTVGQARWQFHTVHRWRTYDLEVDTGELTPWEAATLILERVHELLNALHRHR